MTMTMVYLTAPFATRTLDAHLAHAEGGDAAARKARGPAALRATMMATVPHARATTTKFHMNVSSAVAMR